MSKETNIDRRICKTITNQYNSLGIISMTIINKYEYDGTTNCEKILYDARGLKSTSEFISNKDRCIVNHINTDYVIPNEIEYKYDHNDNITEIINVDTHDYIEYNSDGYVVKIDTYDNKSSALISKSMTEYSEDRYVHTLYSYDICGEIISTRVTEVVDADDREFVYVDDLLSCIIYFDRNYNILREEYYC